MSLIWEEKGAKRSFRGIEADNGEEESAEFTIHIKDFPKFAKEQGWDDSKLSFKTASEWFNKILELYG